MSHAFFSRQNHGKDFNSENRQKSLRRQKHVLKQPQLQQISCIIIMVYRYISPDMKLRALCLLESGWGLDDIVEALGVSLKSITRRELRNHKEHGRVDPLTVLRGRPRILTSDL